LLITSKAEVGSSFMRGGKSIELYAGQDNHSSLIVSTSITAGNSSAGDKGARMELS